jgi:hypothetical protein
LLEEKVSKILADVSTMLAGTSLCSAIPAWTTKTWIKALPKKE